MIAASSVRARKTPERQMPRFIASLTLPFLALASAAGQKTALPVQDLIQPARLVPSQKVDDPERGLRWIYRQMLPGEDVEEVMGAGTLLADRRIRPWFDAGDLPRLLSALTSVEDMKISNGMLLVDKADAAAALEGLSHLRHQLPPRITLEVDLERQNEAGRATLLHARQSVRAGSTAVFEDIQKRLIVRDYDVEIAQSATAANPIIGDLASGSCLAVRARVVPGRGELLFEAFVRVAGEVEAPPLKTFHEGIGPIDRAARELDECGFAMRLPRGAKRAVEWTAANGDRLKLTCSTSWEDPPAGTARGAIVRCRGLFQKGIAEFRTDLPQPDEEPEGFAIQAAFDRAGAESVQIIGDEDSAAMAVVIAGAKADQIDADVSSRLARTLASAELEVVLLDVAEGAEPAEAGKEGAAVARIKGPVIVGKSVAFSGRTEMRYLHDWDIEVAQSSRIPDPIVRVLRHGYHVDARVIADFRGRLEAVALDANVSRLARIDVKQTTLSQEMRAGGIPDQTGSISPSIVLPKDVVAIESPVLQGHSLSTVLQLDENGTAMVRHAAPRLLGRGRDLVVIVRVTK